MAMLTTTKSGVNGSCVCFQLVCQDSKGLICRFSMNRAKVGILEEGLPVVGDRGLATHWVGEELKSLTYVNRMV